MFIQTEKTPNPNSLKFLPGKTVSKGGSFEITKKDNVKNELIRNLMSVNGIEGIFLGKDFKPEIYNIDEHQSKIKKESPKKPLTLR